MPDVIARCTRWMKERLTGEGGAGLAEYALLLFAIAVFAAVTVATFGETIRDTFSDADAGIPIDATTPTTS